MANLEQEQAVTQVTRTVQIIAFALMMGVLTFGAVIVAMGLAEDEPPENPILWIIASVFTVPSILAWQIVPEFVGGRVKKKIVAGKPMTTTAGQQFSEEVGDVGPLLGIYTTKQIIGRAILEGAAFFNLIAYMIEGQVVNLALAGALLLAMLFTFPTRDGVERYVRDELATIEQLRRAER